MEVVLALIHQKTDSSSLSRLLGIPAPSQHSLFYYY